MSHRKHIFNIYKYHSIRVTSLISKIRMAKNSSIAKLGEETIDKNVREAEEEVREAGDVDSPVLPL